mmetsp:Transcript_14524/g.25999  ORF Transcript_14524/g.25999 Transcript_14524/m.25999 type:complete len:218 (+) Transcript_14524:31-684(+)
MAEASNSAAPAAPAALSVDAIFNAILFGLIILVLIWKVFVQGKEKTPKSHAAKKRSPGGSDEQSADSWDEDLASDDEPVDDEPVPVKAKPEVVREVHVLGEEHVLDVPEIHFGQPRCKVMPPRSSGLEAMPTLIKCPVEQLAAEKIDVARVYVEQDVFWVAQGTRSNRMLFAMKKRGDVPQASCVVVEGPPPRKDEDEGDKDPETYGSEVVKIQLIP